MTIKYRREIDGLRALAVLSVIFFHAGFEVLAGGFVGVDIFFVISGYLIATIIVADLEDKKFSLLNFYERRARRILPALFLVMLVSIPFAWLWLIPSDLKDFSKSLIAVPLFVSNILFWRESGYFDVAAEFKPLLHTWSLAVEEQYYLVFPLLLIFLWRFKRGFVLFALIGIFIASLALSDWAVDAKPTAAFYSLFTRGWELLVGVFVALFLLIRKDFEPSGKSAEFGSWVGLILIFYSIFTFDKLTPFPGLYALFPTIGASLVILFAKPSTNVGRLLGSQILVGIGLISYSSYLWHQPIFAFAKHLGLHSSGHYVFFVLSCASLLLGYMTWRFVEGPFRRADYISGRHFTLFALTLGGCLIAMGVWGNLKHGFKDRLPPNIVWQSLGEKLAVKGDICRLAPMPFVENVSACEFGDINAGRKVFLIGDSHAQAIGEELNSAFINSGVKGVKLSLDDCGVMPSILDAKEDPSLKVDCKNRFDALMRYIRAHGAPVILVARWSFRLYPIEGVITQMPYFNSEGGFEKEGYRQYAVNENGALNFSIQAKDRALAELVDGILATKVKLLVVYPVPEIAWDIASLNWIYWRDRKTVLQEISIPYYDYVSRNAFVTDVFDRYLNVSNFHPIRPSEIFCNTYIVDRCVAQYNGLPYYYDDDHLSDHGAKLVVRRIMQDLK